jgi:signal peptidase I
MSQEKSTDREPTPGSRKTIAREYFEALLIAVIFATFARTFVVQAFKIPTGSMEENLLVGDHILVNKFIYGSSPTPVERWLLPVRDVRRGDVVVFKFPEDPTRDFIKRCVGLPGDRIEMHDKRLVINGEEVEDDSYTYHTDDRIYPPSLFYPEQIRLRDNFGPYTVPEDHYFCMGDNRDNSNDSRFWGSVPASYVKGRAFMIYWSFESEPESLQWPGFGGKLRQLGRVALNFFSNTRWSRSFRIVR